MKDHFKFLIKVPRYNHSDFGEYQTAAIFTTAPTLYVSWNLDKGLDPESQIRLAKAELKNAMIEAIMNGEWEIENE